MRKHKDINDNRDNKDQDMNQKDHSVTSQVENKQENASKKNGGKNSTLDKEAHDKKQMVSIEEYEAVNTKYLRALADYENLEKRLERERENASKLANEVLVEKLLPVLDDLDEAIKHIDDDGLNQVHKKLTKVLIKSGVEIIDPLNKDFNPNEHEAIESIAGKSNKVVKVYRKGYRLGNKVLRPAMVAVGNGNA